jgi:PKD repeat protein
MAVITGPSLGEVNQPLTFDGSLSMANSPILTYTWTLGDGALATGTNITHTYTSTGQYLVTLAITDTIGLSDVVTHPVQINPFNPVE